MKKIVATLLLLSLAGKSLQALQTLQTYTPGEPVNAPGGGTGYIIVTNTIDSDKEICLNKEACYAKCAANKKCYVNCQKNQNLNSKIPCSSSTQGKLLKLCKKACDETANYEKPSVENFPVASAHLNGFEGSCSTIQNCLKHHVDDLGWPFQCANIFCAYIDPTDAEPRNFDLEVVDTRKQDIKDFKPDQVPAEFEQMGSEY